MSRVVHDYNFIWIFFIDIMDICNFKKICIQILYIFWCFGAKGRSLICDCTKIWCYLVIHYYIYNRKANPWLHQWFLALMVRNSNICTVFSEMTWKFWDFHAYCISNPLTESNYFHSQKRSEFSMSSVSIFKLAKVSNFLHSVEVKSYILLDNFNYAVYESKHLKQKLHYHDYVGFVLLLLVTLEWKTSNYNR